MRYQGTPKEGLRAGGDEVMSTVVGDCQRPRGSRFLMFSIQIEDSRRSLFPRSESVYRRQSPSHCLRRPCSCAVHQ